MPKMPRRKEFRLVLWADPAEFDTDPAKTNERLLELALQQILLTYEGELEDPKDGVFNSWGQLLALGYHHVKMPSDK